jgi:hypothetical protein
MGKLEVQREESLDSESMHLVSVTKWEDWDSSLELSDQCSIFLKSTYLKMCGIADGARFLSLNGEIVGGVVIPELAASSGVTQIRDFATYQTLWLTSTSSRNFRTVQKQTKIMLALGHLLRDLEDSVLLSLHWSISDVRGLDWAFFGQTSRSIRFVPRYSGLLQFSDYLDFEDYLKSIASGRKSDLKASTACSLHQSIDPNEISEFMDLYECTIPFADSESKIRVLRDVRKIISESNQDGTGTLWIARNQAGEALSGVFIQEFAGNLFYQFGASSDHKLRISPNALLLLKVIQYGFTNNLKSLDFVGMNSPKRGAFKESFNPKPSLYFQVEIH